MSQIEHADRAGMLKAGQDYRVIRDVAAGLSSFRAGDLVTFKSAGYSRYDEAYFYSFTDTLGEPKDFVLGDSEPVARLLETFKAFVS